MRAYLKFLGLFISSLAVILYLSGSIQLFSQEAVEQETAKTEKIEEKAEGEVFNLWLDQKVRGVSELLKNSVLKSISSPFWVSVLMIPLLIVSAWLLGVVTRIVITKPVFALVSKSLEQAADREMFKSAANLTGPIFLVLGIRSSVVPLETWMDNKIEWFNNILNAVLIMTVTILLTRLAISLISAWGHKITKNTETNVDDQLLPLVMGVSKALFYIFGALFAMSSLGINITPLIASLGALSFALGFAVKDSLSNFMAGIFLVLEETFMIGDKISIPGIGTGFIFDIGLRTTKLRTFDNELIVIPNNVLMNKEFKNYRLPDIKIRIVIPFSVAYGTDLDKVRYEITDELKQMQGILEDPGLAVEFLEMADSSLNFQARFFVDDFSKQWDKKIEATDRVYRRLQVAGLEIPFPTRTVYMKNEN
ncbi:MAG: mechanosensitive ion channel family protein [Leptospiraceae bacterium]|nr:mechanosensitive ion channel family protein [Leptospiraceae bacterium]